MSDVFIGNLDYYLPKLSITKVEVLNGKGGIDLVIDYRFIENKEKAVSSRPEYDSYINKAIYSGNPQFLHGRHIWKTFKRSTPSPTFSGKYALLFNVIFWLDRRDDAKF